MKSFFMWGAFFLFSAYVKSQPLPVTDDDEPLPMNSPVYPPTYPTDINFATSTSHSIWLSLLASIQHMGMG